jgi:hypothetical protein
VDPELIDCGWPTIRYLKQNKSIEEAVEALFKLGDKLKSAGAERMAKENAEKLIDENDSRDEPQTT